MLKRCGRRGGWGITLLALVTTFAATTLPQLLIEERVALADGPALPPGFNIDPSGFRGYGAALWDLETGEFYWRPGMNATLPNGQPHPNAAKLRNGVHGRMADDLKLPVPTDGSPSTRLRAGGFFVESDGAGGIRICIGPECIRSVMDGEKIPFMPPEQRGPFFKRMGKALKRSIFPRNASANGILVEPSPELFPRGAGAGPGQAEALVPHEFQMSPAGKARPRGFNAAEFSAGPGLMIMAAAAAGLDFTGSLLMEHGQTTTALAAGLAMRGFTGGLHSEFLSRITTPEYWAAVYKILADNKRRECETATAVTGHLNYPPVATNEGSRHVFIEGDVAPSGYGGSNGLLDQGSFDRLRRMGVMPFADPRATFLPSSSPKHPSYVAPAPAPSVAPRPPSWVYPWDSRAVWPSLGSIF